MPIFAHITLVMFAFAANSLLCRMSLANELIDPASFTLLRIVSGAITLILVSQRVATPYSQLFSLSRNAIVSSLSLFGYATLFSFAYVSLSTGTGALLLFGMVQLSLITWSLIQGHRFNGREVFGVGLSLIGFVVLMLPSAEQPSLISGVMMALSGLCWAIFTLIGKKQQSSLYAITRGFAGAMLLSVLLLPFTFVYANLSLHGVILAVISGAITSSLGYYLWYQVLPKISTLNASISQLSVPVIAMVMGSLLLDETISVRTALLSMMILLGITITFLSRKE
ncbi:DMT family transporter [Vibrio astriarenae]